jgi:GntR family transcriptional regulator
MANQIPASQKLHDRLATLISETQAGYRLPSEPELAREMGVSRATLREAMRIFETQGLIRRRQGAGTYVLHPSHVIESGLEVLESIETLAERIDLKVTMGELKVEHRLPTVEESEALQLSSATMVVHLARVINAGDRSVAYLIDIVPEHILDPGELDEQFSGSILDFILQRGTPDLMSSRCEINAVTADSDIARALGIQRGDVLLRFEAFLYDPAGSVVDYSFSYFLPGVFRFHVVRKVGS